jgi:1-acyl-sn-glycerol-3-phosphate acyltransferase
MLLEAIRFLRSLFLTVPSILAFGAFTLVFGLYDFLMRDRLLKQGRWGPVGTFSKLWWSYWMLWSHRIQVVASGPGLDELRKHRGCVFVSNHQSLMDIPALVQFLPCYTSFIAKQELRSIPIFGSASALVGTLFVDRSRGAENASLKVIHTLLRRGISILIFPEGTRSADGRLGNFKRGGFVMAIEAQVPIIPITILDSRFVLPKNKLAIRKGVIHIVFDKPISTVGLRPEDRHALSDQVHQIMSKHLDLFEETRKNRPHGGDLHS